MQIFLSFYPDSYSNGQVFCKNLLKFLQIRKKQAHLPTKTTALIEFAKDYPKGPFHAQENPAFFLLLMQHGNRPFVEVHC